jgi:hypothetical protein
VFEQVRPLVAPLLARHGVTLLSATDDPGAPSPVVAADATRLVQVLVNLVGNGAKYNRPGGQVRLQWQVEDATARLSVIDTGVGMTPEQLRHLYEPFNRLGRESSGVEGTGIGLVITRHLVELMSGRMDVRSEPGRGTTIEVVLPLAAGQAAAPGPGPQAPVAAAASPGVPAAPPAPAPARVLYIEDNEVNAQLMRAILRQRPQVMLEVCHDAATGLASARRAPPDLVLLDMHLPDARGDEVLSRLQAESSLARVPVVVLSADATWAQVDEMRRRGVRDYLTKPLDLTATLRVIDTAVGGPAAPGPVAESSSAMAPPPGQPASVGGHMQGGDGASKTPVGPHGG